MAKMQVAVRLEPELLRAVDLLARRAGWSRTSAIERAVGLGLGLLQRSVDVASSKWVNKFLRLMVQVESEEQRREVLDVLNHLIEDRAGLPGVEVGG